MQLGARKHKSYIGYKCIDVWTNWGMYNEVIKCDKRIN